MIRQTVEDLVNRIRSLQSSQIISICLTTCHLLNGRSRPTANPFRYDNRPFIFLPALPLHRHHQHEATPPTWLDLPRPSLPINHTKLHSHPPPRPRIGAEVVDGVPAQGAGVLVAALEPLVQAGAVEEVLAGLAALVGHALVGAYDAVADGALALALHRADHVAPERHQAVDDASALLFRGLISECFDS